ncbi:MAG: DUF374 domain-containing protein [Acidobacteriota bacterium]|nr:DUF374 domain-containing protein [Acidobacteriota bacterium]MDE2923301.1 DUF374 domain-containing protein [Acidobacteriota bacterium]MDE3266769.1 DUF374 domain-containing protein [Acidobacteriota bacterium]
MKVRGAALAPAAVALRFLSQAVTATWRLRHLEGGEHLERALQPPAMLACWHEQTALSLLLVRRYLLPAGGPVSILASHSADGELSARIGKAWGIRVTRGSTSRGGRDAALHLYGELRRHRSTLLLMPDGPRGPAREAKPGGIVLAATSGAPIVPAGIAAARAFRVRSWDRMTIGLPFTRVAVAVGEPMVLERRTTDAEREEARLELGARLDALTARAGQLLSQRP